MSDAEQRIERLSREVVAILKDRGIEATQQQVVDWSRLMCEQSKSRNKKHSEQHQWLWAVTENLPYPTMALHLHFGDAK